MSPAPLAGRRAPRAGLPRRAGCARLGPSLLGASGKTRASSCERAASAAATGEKALCEDHTSAAHDEEELFHSVLRELGWAPPGKR